MLRYRVLIEHRARASRDYPRQFMRLTVTARTPAEAASLALQMPSVIALAELFVSATVGLIGTPVVKE